MNLKHKIKGAMETAAAERAAQELFKMFAGLECAVANVRLALLAHSREMMRQVIGAGADKAELGIALELANRSLNTAKELERTYNKAFDEAKDMILPPLSWKLN